MSRGKGKVSFMSIQPAQWGAGNVNNGVYGEVAEMRLFFCVVERGTKRFGSGVEADFSESARVWRFY